MKAVPVDPADVAAVAAHCRATLPLETVHAAEYFSSLPLCVIDAVFSIGVRYESTLNTVRRYADYAGVPVTHPHYPDPIPNEVTIRDLLGHYAALGLDGMIDTVYRNRQRTSPRGGILKAEAVQHFAQALADSGIDTLTDAPAIIGDPAFEARITAIPGQRSGISLRYFYMLIGSTDFVKPDRMILRFIHAALGRTPTPDEAHALILAACAALQTDYPALTPRGLDALIWQYQRGQ